MTKASGLGDNFYIGGYDLSGNVGSLSKISGGPAVLDVTAINKFANERLGGLRSGEIDFSTFFDTAAGAEHVALSALPTTDVILTYCHGAVFGHQAACLVAKQIDYAGTRGADGSLTFDVAAQSDGFGLEWGQQLTAGLFASPNSLTGQNAGFEGGIGTWAATTGTPAIVSSTDQAHSGSDSLKLTSAASGNMGAASSSAAAILTNGIPVVAGQGVYVQAWFRSAVSARSCNLQVNWYDNTGTTTGSTSTSGSITDSTSAWTMASASFTAPASAAFFRVNGQVLSTAASNEVHYLDDVMVVVMPGINDNGGSTAFGAQAYLQLTAFTGTDITVKIQHSSDGTTWADLMTFAQVTAAPSAQRISVSNATTVNEFVQAVAVSTAGYTAASWSVVFTRNLIAGEVF